MGNKKDKKIVFTNLTIPIGNYKVGKRWKIVEIKLDDLIRTFKEIGVKITIK